MSYKTDIDNHNNRLETDNIIIDNLISNLSNLPSLNDVNVLNEDVLEGKTYYANGMLRTGTMNNIGQQIIIPNDSIQNISEGYHDGTGYVDIGLNTSDANAVPLNIKAGVIAYTNIGKITGTLPVLTYPVNPNNPSDWDYQFQAATTALKRVTRDNITYIMGGHTIADGKESWMFEGNSKMKMGFTESNIATLVGLTANKLKSGVNILGVVGNLEPDKPDQSKTVSPSTSQQIITPDTGYELASVTVEAIETETKTVKSTTSSQTVIPTTGKFINEITVSPISLESKDITINQNGTTTITPSQNYDGLSDVDVTVSGILDTSDANATGADMPNGKSAYVNGQKVNGYLNEYTSGRTISSEYTDWFNIEPPGYISPRGKISSDCVARANAKIIWNIPLSDIASRVGAEANKIKKNEVICGVTGTYEGIISEQEYDDCIETANAILGIS